MRVKLPMMRALTGCAVAAAVLCAPVSAQALDLTDDTWQLKVATGEDLGAGTDASLYATVECHRAKADGSPDLTKFDHGPRTLLDLPGNDHERYMERIYNIQVPKSCADAWSVKFELQGSERGDNLGDPWQFRKLTLITPTGTRWFGGEGSGAQRGFWLTPSTSNDRLVAKTDYVRSTY